MLTSYADLNRDAMNEHGHFIQCIKKYDSTFQVKMGQVQNDRHYVRYRSGSAKTKAEECKKLMDNIPMLFYCEIYFVSSANLSQD